MRRLSLQIALVLSTFFVAGTAFAGPECTKEPQSKWKSEEQMKEHIASLGYKIKLFKISGNCYEIYGWTKAGAKAEIYFNPVTAAIVKSKIEGQ